MNHEWPDPHTCKPQMMIILRLKGGLGNQLFQYAAARQIAFNNNVELLLDTKSGFENDAFKRRYALDNFRIVAKIAPSEMMPRFVSRLNRKLVRTCQQFLLPLRSRSYVIEGKRQFNPELLAVRFKRPVYLEGYFQSYRYFSGIKDIVRQELQLKEFSSIQSSECLSKISAVNAVSIHLRSYNANQANDTSKINGICSAQYYSAAIAHIKECVTNPVFFVFSDNMAWAKNHLETLSSSLRRVIYMDTGKDQDDLCLMSSCKHNIIANSTFSWWGAWLNTNPNKIVVAPKDWFASEQFSVNDIYPENWVKI